MRDPGLTPADGPASVSALATRADAFGTFGTEAALPASPRSVRESEALRAALRASVTAYVRRLHDEQVPPQRMLVLVKEAVRDATPAEVDVLERRELMESVVRWSIEAYYAG